MRCHRCMGTLFEPFYKLPNGMPELWRVERIGCGPEYHPKPCADCTNLTWDQRERRIDRLCGIGMKQWVGAYWLAMRGIDTSDPRTQLELGELIYEHDLQMWLVEQSRREKAEAVAKAAEASIAEAKP